jgi:hypothetical protein
MEGCRLDSCVPGLGQNDLGYNISATADSRNLLTEGVITLSFSRRDYLVYYLVIYLFIYRVAI